MRNRGWILFIGSIILLAALTGIGVLVFRAGMAQGASAGMAGVDSTRPWFIGTPLLKIGLSVVLLLFLLKFVSRMIFFPLFGMGMHDRRWRTTAHGPWLRPGPWGDDQNVPPFFQTWHDQAHSENRNEDPLERQEES